MAKGEPVDGYTATEVALLLTAAALIGFSKTAIGGVSSISVAIFAAVLPARQSTGLVLPLLILGDVFAVSAYRHHVQWRVLLRLVPAVLVGIVVGAYFVSRVDDVVMRRTIGVVLLCLVAVNVWNRSRGSASSDGEQTAMSASGHRVAAGVYGTLTGFTTMVANAGGPVMSLYMLAVRMPMLAFLGLGAWLFALFNLFKIPFSIGLGLMTWDSLLLDAALAPALVIGALVGRRVIRRLDQAMFERIVLVVTVLAALNLVR